MLTEAFVAALKSARVAVIGDVMVDHYVYGAVQRISPEAPVPVLHVAGERYVLGGAANVAANIAALGGFARLCGIVGEDPAADRLRALIADLVAIEPDMAASPTHATIIKTRYLGDRQQIVRVDREMRAPHGAETIADLTQRVAAAIAACDVVVLSDYGKGVLGDAVLAAAFEVARRAAKPVIVDPKRLNFADYRGAAIITPNRRELEAAVGLPTETDAETAAAAARAIESCGAAILLTRSEKGMSLFRAGQAPIHLPTLAREVFDVSGAGDTVVAALACGLGAGLPVDVAMALANAAAGVVVGKLGTAVCTAEELAAALEAPLDAGEAAPIPATWEEAAQRRAAWKAKGLKVGFANGCFDLLHPGHVTLLQRAAAQVDRLIVAINSDASVSALKGPQRPVQTEAARAFVLAGLSGVDLVTVFSEPTPYDLIAKLIPDVVFKGADYAEADVVGGDLVKAAGGRVALIDLVAGQSTSALVRRARADD
jgi:D-beta-D-heptose 7-phosphate kinase/D-beta-D-heptose 1-phosphate adenosyltransferase